MQGFEIFETPEGQEMLEELGQVIGEALEGMDAEQLAEFGQAMSELGELDYSGPPSNREVVAFESTPAKQELDYSGPPSNREFAYDAPPAKQELDYSGPPSNREFAYDAPPAKQELDYSGPPSNREVAFESTPAKLEGVERRAGEVPILEVDEANRAPTMEIQAREIGEYFRETPELQYENWVKLSANERVEALQALENEVAAIAHRPAVEVRAENLKEGLFGQNRGNCQVINTTYLMDNSREMYVENLDTLIHEGRHGYQNWNVHLAEIGAPVVEQNLEWVNAWRVNMLDLGYSQSDAKFFDGLGFERYYTQPIEVDARAFAAQVIHEMGLR